MDAVLSNGNALRTHGLMLPAPAWYDAIAMPPGRDRDEALLKIHTRATIQRRREERLRRLQIEFVDRSPLRVDPVCLQSYPCQHAVTLYSKPSGTWSGDKIAQWYVDHDHPVPPHFWCYLKTNYKPS